MGIDEHVLRRSVSRGSVSDSGNLTEAPLREAFVHSP
jgi:hypothetical protein